MHSPLDDEACYRALQAHDARFDGCFFTGVTSTGIYCRPVCRVRTPRRENCRFFVHAAQAEQAGFRPCLRCRPELAPQALPWSIQDASATLARQAAQWLDDPGHWATGCTMEQLAARLGVSSRHLRRIFEARFGVSPLQYLQTRRLLCAKQLLADTTLPVAEVALSSGFESVRRFNAAFAGHYGLSPTLLRRQGTGLAHTGGAVRLGYRPPYDVPAMLDFFARRQIAGVEAVEGNTLRSTVRLAQGERYYEGWMEIVFEPTRHQALLRVSDTLRTALPLLIARARALLDLDADPHAINPVLHASFPLGDGLRVPGALDGFELAVRAVLGQQITVVAARTLGGRLVERFGTPITTPHAALSYLFPNAEALASASSESLGQLGIVRQRQAAIGALARAVLEGRLALWPGGDIAATLATLKALPGIGDWTAQYIAMRALRWPDAFPAGDVALQKALGVHRTGDAEAASQAWRPWRSYAVMRAWRAGSTASQPTKETAP
ncbi:MAG TPA: AlkA N-terminal domain-containing protein [Burkholderiaceae bacterium]